MRLIAIVQAALLVTGCITSGPPASAPPTALPTDGSATGAPGPTSTTASTTPATGSTPSTGASPTVAESLPPGVPADVFTAPADPLTLTSTVDDEAAETAVIGPDGGTVSATGADGTAYELTIEEGALPLPVEVTMSPLTSVTGFPADVTPEQTLGVLLGPDGLELAVPGTLRILPAEPVPLEAAFGFAFRGTGEETSFHLFEASDGGLVVEVNHFSGNAIAFPIPLARERPAILRQLFSQAQIEARLASEVAFWLSVVRQDSLRGRTTFWTHESLARAFLPLFKRLVISPRVAVADRSCADAQAALLAYLEYQHQRQLLGVADDPSFDLVGAGLFVPADLVDLTVRVCFKEAYERCVRSGEWPQLAVYFLWVLSRSQNAFGIPPTQEAIDLATDYLKRCGRWRVKLSTSVREEVSEFFIDHIEATREFHVQWKPGTGLIGAIDSTIEGSGAIDVTLIDIFAIWTTTVSNIQTTRDATARILFFEWDHYEGPTLTGEPLPAVPTKLRMAVDFGQITYDFVRHHADADLEGSRDDFFWVYVLALRKQQGREVIPAEILIRLESGEEVTALFEKDWQFSTNPYRATYAASDEYQFTTMGPSPVDVRVEVLVEHDPQ